jgi:hypothetical protein
VFLRRQSLIFYSIGSSWAVKASIRSINFSLSRWRKGNDYFNVDTIFVGRRRTNGAATTSFGGADIDIRLSVSIAIAIGVSRKRHVPTRVARFFSVQHSKTVKYTKMTTKYTQWYKHIWNGSSIDRMAVKFTNIFHCKTIQNLSKLGFLVWKYTI